MFPKGCYFSHMSLNFLAFALVLYTHTYNIAVATSLPLLFAKRPTQAAILVAIIARTLHGPYIIVETVQALVL